MKKSPFDDVVGIAIVLSTLVSIAAVFFFLEVGPFSPKEEKNERVSQKPTQSTLSKESAEDNSTQSQSSHQATKNNQEMLTTGEKIGGSDSDLSRSAPAHTFLQANIPFSKSDKANRNSPIGMNTNEIYDEDASLPFVDLFKNASPFKEKSTCPASEPELCISTKDVVYNDIGWPIDLMGGHAATKFIGQMPKDALPAGQYIVLYEGTGKIEYGHDVNLVEHTLGRDLIDFSKDEDGTIDASLIITETDKDDPIRNISVLMPGGICQTNPYQHVSNDSDCGGSKYLSYEKYATSIIFNPDYLRFMRDFSVLRFMPMSGITRNNESEWHERPSWKEPSWGGTYGSRGAPIEVMIELANRLQADPWFNIPHAATDDYIIKYAELVKEKLDPNLNVYIEYTNEAWNTNFIHAEYTQKRGIEQKLDANALEAGYKFYTKRSREVFALWKEHFDSTNRLIRVLGGWDTRADITKKLLGYDDAYKEVDVLAVAPYVGGNTRGFRASKTVDEIFHLLTDKKSYRALPEILEHIESQATLAHDFGVRLIAYEGGQGLVDWATRSPDQHPNPLFFAANRDPRMNLLYEKMLHGWKEAGGDLFVAFSAPRTCQWFGCWGLKEHIRMPLEKSPKYSAVLDFAKRTPMWWNKTYRQVKPESHDVPQQAVADPKKARIVIRPARGEYSAFHRLDNPRTLDVIVKGNTWDKKDISGKWQAKWDKQNLYLTVRVYDDDVISTADQPNASDFVEFFIDADNSRRKSYDRRNDFHFVFKWEKNSAASVDPSPSTNLAAVKTVWKKNADGYELQADIPWSVLKVSPKVANRIGVEVNVTDYDKGETEAGKIAWISDNPEVTQNPQTFGVVLISGR